MNEKYISKKNHSFSTVFLFFLIITFALFVFIVTVLGVKSYHKVVDDADKSYQARSSILYVVNKLRSADKEYSVEVEVREGIEILVLQEVIGDEMYETLIYYSNGALREIFKNADTDTDLSLGDEVVAVNGFTVNIIGDMVYFSITDLDDKSFETHVLMQSQQ